MPNLSLGTIEVLGLPAAVEAANVACKTADVTLIGYETTDGMGMVAVKIEGQVSAVKSAIAAGAAAASRVTKVFATSVIPRPSDQLRPIVLTDVTVGLAKPKAASAPAPAPAVEPTPVEEPVVVAEVEPSIPTSDAVDIETVAAPAEPEEAVPAPVESEETVPAPAEPEEATPEETSATPPATPAPRGPRRSPRSKSRSTKEE